MTVSYTAQVTSCRQFGCFWRLLFRWKGSIYKLLWPNLMVYVMLYSTLSFVYRFLLNEKERTIFEKFSLHCQVYSDLIPVSFVLGFYVSIVIKRWWDQYLTIPWPDPLAVFVSAFLKGQIGDDFSLKTLIDEINKFRGGCGGLLNFDWISIPLVYTQVVTLAVYTYFTATLMGNQYLDPSKGYPNHTIDLVIPVFTLLQFFFYMGWLLVAETLVNPFGEDDDDFEVNWLIDRNLQISYVIVDEMHQEHPELIKDQYWDQIFPAELPYTEATKQYFVETFLGSTFGVDVPEHMQNFILLSEQAALKEETRKETAPVSIKGSPQESDTFPFPAALDVNPFGSSASLRKPFWKRSKRNRESRNFSMCSVPKRYISEDYQDEVFKMSDLSLASSRNQGIKFSSVKYGMNMKSSKQSRMLVSNQGNWQNNKSIGPFPFQAKCAKRDRIFLNNKKQRQSILDESCTEKPLGESSQCLLSFRKRSDSEISYPIFTKLRIIESINDVNEEQNVDVPIETNTQPSDLSNTGSISVLTSKEVNSLKIMNSNLFQAEKEIIDSTSQKNEKMALERKLIHFEEQGSSTGAFTEDKAGLKHKSLNEVFYEFDMDLNEKNQNDLEGRKNEYITEKIVSEVNIADVVIDISSEKTQPRNDRFKEKLATEPI